MRVLAPRAVVPRLSRRAFLAGATVVGIGVLSGCDDRKYAPTAAPDGVAEDRLNVYSWGDYDAPRNIRDFRDGQGITVQMYAFASNEEMLAKLGTSRGTSGYDIVVPGAVFAKPQIDGGLLAKLLVGALHRTGVVDSFAIGPYPTARTPDSRVSQG